MGKTHRLTLWILVLTTISNWVSASLEVAWKSCTSQNLQILLLLLLNPLDTQGYNNFSSSQQLYGWLYPQRYAFGCSFQHLELSPAQPFSNLTGQSTDGPIGHNLRVRVTQGGLVTADDNAIGQRPSKT